MNLETEMKFESKGIEMKEDTVSLVSAWEHYRHFETWSLPCRRTNDGLAMVGFLEEWEARLQRARDAGCQYSDRVLVFQLLHKSQLEGNQVLEILNEIEHLANKRNNSNILGKTKLLLMDYSKEGVLTTASKRNLSLINEEEKSFSPLNNVAVEEELKVEQDWEEVEDEVDNQEWDTSDSTTCSICQKIFTRKYDLKVHMRRHTGEKPYRCDNCSAGFTCNQLLNKHRRKNPGCSSIIGESSGTVRTGTVDGEQFKCDQCHKFFTRRYDLKVHTRIHTGEKPYHCHICGDLFTSSQQYNRHRRTHRSISKFSCHVCGQGCHDANELKKHQLVHKSTDNEAEINHSLDSDYTCKKCQETFNSAAKLKEHSSTTHADPHSSDLSTAFQCEVCGKSFSRKKNLASHNKIHTDEKRLECSVCGKAFHQAGNLKIHLRVHNGEKPFHCEVCGKSFSIKKSLVIHTRIHSGEKPFTCEVCGKCFTYDHVLKLHYRTHTGEKPHQCHVCPKSFARRHHLTEHMRTHAKTVCTLSGPHLPTELSQLPSAVIV